MEIEQKGIRMIEFFSGIGGMRYGVEDALRHLASSNNTTAATPPAPQESNNISSLGTSGTDGKSLHSCSAYEISIYANETYAHNFEDSQQMRSVKNRAKQSSTKSRSSNSRTKEGSSSLFTVRTKLVEQLKPENIDGMADLWTMSPPCQPFTTTRNAKQKDTKDGRSRGFEAIGDLLMNIESKPKWILLENVKGFLGSDALEKWYKCLRDCGYSWKEYLVSPIQFGIPNNRTRYYMICEKSDRFWLEGGKCESVCSTVEISYPIGSRVGVIKQNLKEDSTIRSILGPRKLSHYIQNLHAHPQYTISDKVLQEKWAKDIPIVSIHDEITHCFTAAYGRQIHKATGSLILMDSTRSKSIQESPLPRENMIQYQNKIRRFTPDELLHLFGYPKEFTFPESISLEHRFKLIGNSVNCVVVSQIARILLGNSN